MNSPMKEQTEGLKPLDLDARREQWARIIDPGEGLWDDIEPDTPKVIVAQIKHRRSVALAKADQIIATLPVKGKTPEPLIPLKDACAIFDAIKEETDALDHLDSDEVEGCVSAIMRTRLTLPARPAPLPRVEAEVAEARDAALALAASVVRGIAAEPRNKGQRQAALNSAARRVEGLRNLAAAPEPPRVSVEEVERLRADIDRLEADGGYAVRHGTPSAEHSLVNKPSGPPIRWNRDMAADLRSVLALIDMLPGDEVGGSRDHDLTADAATTRPGKSGSPLVRGER